jgi:hypothetical protein
MGQGRTKRLVRRWKLIAGFMPALAFLASFNGQERQVLAQLPAITLEDINEFHELMIVHPTVVDPYLNGKRSHNGGPSFAGGSWSFRSLMEGIMRQANGGQVPSQAFRDQFLTQFLESWLSQQTLANGQALPPRDSERVRALLLDPFSTVNPSTGARTFELWKAPFELIAIANRADLQGGTDAGELRFVFKLNTPEVGDQKFTLIVEFKVPTDRWSRTTWAHVWHKLSSFEIGSDEYLRHLETITGHITGWWPYETAYPRRVSQVRTNEIALATNSQRLWEMREFKPGAGGALCLPCRSISLTTR